MHTLVVRVAHSLFDTTVGTFLGPPFEVLGSRATKRRSEEGTYTGIEETVCAARTTTLIINSINHSFRPCPP